MKTKLISEFGDGYKFVSIDYDVAHIKEHYCADSEEELKDFDSLFIKLDDSGTEYAEIWGVRGIVPRLADYATRLNVSF